MILKQLKMKIRFVNSKRIFRKLYFIFKILILITVVHLLINVYFFQNTNSDRQKDADLLFKNKNLKYVQLLTGRFDYKNWALSNLGEEAFKNCKEKRCFAFKPFTIRQKPLEQSDAILVHVPNLYYMPNKKTYKRNRKQLWMYYSMESPRGTYCSMHYKPTELDDWFNLTATYKQDSNFVTDYKPGFHKWSKIKENPNYINEFKKQKTNLTESLLKKIHQTTNKASVIWIVSHCETSSRREDYIQEMLKYIKVDIYGKCDGYFKQSKPIPCPNNGTFRQCFTDLINTYKFYLAFENSLCDDYITEKYFKFYTKEMIFTTNILPVVRGAKPEQYSQLNNYNSLIIADEFISPKALAYYLNYLTENSTAYLEYFQWKLNLFKDLSQNSITNLNNENTIKLVQSDVQSPLCYLCEMLHNETYLNSETNPVWKISEWFSVKHSCRDQDEKRRLFFWLAQFAGYCF